MFVKVALNINSNELYTYILPLKYENDEGLVGSRCLVEFGYQQMFGYIVEIYEKETSQYNFKEIIEVLDTFNEINAEQLQLAKTLSEKTRRPLARILDLMLPSSLKTSYKRYLYIINPLSIDVNIACLFRGNKKILITDDIKKHLPLIKKEVEKGNVEIGYDLYQYGKSKKEKVYSLVNDSHQTPLRDKVISFLKNNGSKTKEEIISSLRVSEYLISSLEKNKTIKSEYILKQSFDEDTKLRKSKTSYSFIQESIIESFNNNTQKPSLLVSNDERFKKMMILDASFNALSENKDVLIYCPLIFEAYDYYDFLMRNLKGASIFLLTSKTATTDEYDAYYKISNSSKNIVVTTKIGLFVPLRKIGFIALIDEENINHNIDELSMLNASFILEERRKYFNSKMLITSLSPRIETYYNSIHGAYKLLSYNKENNQTIEKVDMHYEIENVILSKRLRSLLEENINKKKLSLLIVNSKAHSSSLICEDCGKTLKCPHCGVNLLYQSEKKIIACPYCSYKKDFLECDSCHSHNFNKLGFGLEKVKEVLKTLFNKVNVLQIDSEFFKKETVMQEELLKIEEGYYDIIIGTNSVLDINLSNISLTALLKGDSMSDINDYRGSELNYSFISKAIASASENVVIQGRFFDDEVIEFALKNDFSSFYENEIKKRNSFSYPPFIKLFVIKVTGEYKSLYHAANYFKMIFNKMKIGSCLGPVYNRQEKGVLLTLKCDNFERLTKLIDEVNNKFNKEKVKIDLIYNQKVL